MLLLESIRAQI